MADKDKAPPVVVEQTEDRPTRGAQVILTGDAQKAARGGFGTDIVDNVRVKRALEADGTVPDGNGPDGTVADRPAADLVVTEGGKAGGAVPAQEGTTRVEAKPAPQPAAPQKQG